ncbi:MAG: hypothetical protein R3335_09495 [Anaerolineales bacterium]|nr:hypothetical protein [Anaerolineales bacterium]
MILMNEEMVQEQRRTQMMTDAEQYRLRRPKPTPPVPATRTYHSLLARLGDLLFIWGCRLRTRYRQVPHPASGRS